MNTIPALLWLLVITGLAFVGIAALAGYPKPIAALVGGALIWLWIMFTLRTVYDLEKRNREANDDHN